ncbi:TDP-N-acetylfucosamine:lipid II N-acetylfucosaminyltransferase [Psychrobacter namhaensis]|uniref:TDP-N-acetylfucosamine:lipid II N-acetylfucosaminyltransferase n=1 Tax=Psychrobacter namhaensis TaxID=292734 RepID=UPI003FD0BAC3
MTLRILHISDCDKFIPPYIKFIKNNFEKDFENHKFLMTGGMAVDALPNYSNIHLITHSQFGKLKHHLHLILEINRSDKVIIHNLFNFKNVILLFFMPWNLKKTYWIMWGADLYTYKLGSHDFKWKFREFFRKRVIRNFGYFSTTVPGDFELVKDWYKSKSVFIQNLMYPSHLYRNLMPTQSQDKSEIYIQVGNSADPTNNHHEVLKYISELELNDYKVFCPLSYGSPSHRESVIHYGENLLGEKFIPITDYMEFSEYNKYMSSIDIAIFNHDRQQAMGNMIGLLSLGKKVILKPTTTPYDFFKSLGLKIYSLDDKDVMEPLYKGDKMQNIKIMRDNFSPKKLKSDWERIFYG